MQAWREIATPHEDVLSGKFQQSEFAVDLRVVLAGKAPPTYQDTRTFFQRTFITEGMRLLLTQVAERLNGRGGEPVIQLQTAFGGGKTHTMLAVYHLATRTCALKELHGIPSLLEQAGLLDIPRARVAVLDGNAHSPGQPWKHDGIEIHTLWGELAWQLGGAEGFERVRQADRTGTSPGKEVLQELLTGAAPCVVLIDELVSYVRQFSEDRRFSGGTYDSNLSFVQALTEAIKMVPDAMLLASLPESEIEVGSNVGLGALKALEKIFGRVQAIWKPVATEESFEIVRRRLFEPIKREAERDEVCAAFAELYRKESGRLPSETQQARYMERMRRSYPIHPEVLDRLYEDWATLDSFQRTRGVLKLMARVILRLWKDQNQDAMLLPGSLPLYDGGVRDELIAHLGAGWNPVLDTDIDGDRAEASEIDTRDPRLGAQQAARRVARTLFLGSAPSSVALRPGNTRGMERGRILLGCLQPGASSSSSIFHDALNRLGDRLHYLNASGDRAQDGARFWFDVRANLRREMEDRKGKFDERKEVYRKISEVLTRVSSGRSLFDGVHVFTPHADIPDDSALRLVLLDPAHRYSKQDHAQVTAKVVEYVQQNGSRPRFRANRLIFVAPDASNWSRLQDAVRAALAWASIVQDIETRQLNVDQLQGDQARKERETADAVVQRATRDCYRWVLCPVQHAATDREIKVEAFAMNPTPSSSFQVELGRVCEENELIISAWSPIHLRTRLQELYWKPPVEAVKALSVWEDMQKYLYLPRLRGRSVFEQAVQAGATSEDFFGTSCGRSGDRYEGFQLGRGGVQIDDTLLLIEPEAAQAYRKAIATPKPPPVEHAAPVNPQEPARLPVEEREPAPAATPAERKVRSFFGSVEVKASAARMNLMTIAEEVIQLLASDPKAKVQITLEIRAEFPAGPPEHVRLGVSENTVQLGFKNREWE